MIFPIIFIHEAERDTDGQMLMGLYYQYFGYMWETTTNWGVEIHYCHGNNIYQTV